MMMVDSQCCRDMCCGEVEGEPKHNTNIKHDDWREAIISTVDGQVIDYKLGNIFRCSLVHADNLARGPLVFCI